MAPDTGGTLDSATVTDDSPPPPPVHADYDSELREPTPRADGLVHVDSPLLVSRLQALGVDTYAFLVYHSPSDWDDFAEYLPLAEAAGIHTWLYLVNPSQQPGPRDYPPFEDDYAAWARAASELAVAYPSFSAIVMDDFSGGGAFGGTYVCEIMQEAPNLKFYAVEYEQNVLGDFNTVEGRECVDGLVFPYVDLDDNGALRAQIDEIAALREPIPSAMRIAHAWNTPSAPGQYGRYSATCSAGVLSFTYDDGFAAETAGYHLVRVRSGGAVLFEEDVANAEAGESYLLSIGDGPVTVGIEEDLGVGNFGVDVTLVGLDAPSCGPWSWESSSDGFSGGFGDIPAWVGMELYPMVYAEGTSWHHAPPTPEILGSALDIALQACDDGVAQGVITYCVPKESEDGALFGVVQERYRAE